MLRARLVHGDVKKSYSLNFPTKTSISISHRRPHWTLTAAALTPPRAPAPAPHSSAAWTESGSASSDAKFGSELACNFPPFNVRKSKPIKKIAGKEVETKKKYRFFNR